MSRRKTAVLLILDGWGHREESDYNAIHAADSPVWDELWGERPHTLLRTSGEAVGLPAGQMGNSEVGHMNIGAGRVVYQTLTRIDRDIEEGKFFSNPALTEAAGKVVSNGSALHVIGLLSPGGIHSHEDQIMAMLDLALERGVGRLYLHALLDGRDTPPRSALASLKKFEAKLAASSKGKLASICGRFYAMDRDQRWERVEPAWAMLAEGVAPFRFPDAESALLAAYERGEDDEFVQASLIGEADAAVGDGDAVVFMNFRADRARQLTRAFVEDDFDGFTRKRRPELADFVMLTEYAADIPANCAFPPEQLKNVFGAWLADRGGSQLRIAETEKYAHVTFFFNGGREEPFANEERELIPSPKVKTYDLKPEMSAFELTDRLTAAIRSGDFDAIVCNYANGDMVGHTGSFEASIKAVEAVDQCLGKIVEAVLETGADLLITADHGNVEQMRDPESGQPLTSHTTGPVPLVYVGANELKFTTEGSLCDIAPTLLSLLKLPIPQEMTGEVLLREPFSIRTA